MVSLLDIASTPRVVEMRGVAIPVYGVSADGIAHLLRKFPELRALMTGHEVNLTPENIIDKAPGAIAAIIAAGCGYPGREDAEATAATLTISEQLELLAVILEQTLPQGIGPFVASLGNLMRSLGADSATPIKAPDSK